MRNNQLFKVVTKNCNYRQGSICRMWYNDGTEMPRLFGLMTVRKHNCWTELYHVRKIKNNKKNLRAFAKQMRNVRWLYDTGPAPNHL